MEKKYVRLDKEDGIGWIRFNRPDKLNALNSKVFGEAELVMTGEMIKAAQASDLGILNRVVEPTALEDEVKTLAGKLMNKSAVALRAAKIAMRRGLGVSLKDGLQMEQDLFCMLFGTTDQKEGMAAFLEKRKPAFIGK